MQVARARSPGAADDPDLLPGVDAVPGLERRRLREVQVSLIADAFGVRRDRDVVAGGALVAASPHDASARSDELDAAVGHHVLALMPTAAAEAPCAHAVDVLAADREDERVEIEGVATVVDRREPAEAATAPARGERRAKCVATGCGELRPFALPLQSTEIGLAGRCGELPVRDGAAVVDVHEGDLGGQVARAGGLRASSERAAWRRGTPRAACSFPPSG